VIIAGLLGAVVMFVSAAGEQGASSQASTSPDAFEGNSVARVVSLEPDMDEVFVAHLRDCYLPVWHQLRSDEAVSSVSVFKLSPADSATMAGPARNYLLLAELGPQAKPDDLFAAEKASGCLEGPASTSFAVLRSVHMACTPNFCYAMPEPAYRDAPSGIDYLIEFIGVEATPDHLAKYRELVSTYFGPANGVLVERGMLHCFIALEAAEVLFEVPGALQWNQVHISDDWDEGGEIDWYSVYVDLFRSQFSCDLDSVWAELPPTGERRADYSGRLIPELSVR
jgi:hypothetical protein